MPKVAILNDFSKVDAAKGFSEYTGPTPPKGVYRFIVKKWMLVENSSGDQMFKLILEINEPKKSKKAQYNGYAVWHNANLTEAGGPYVNAMIDALDIPRKAIWGKTSNVITSKDDDERVIKIGGKKVDGLEVVCTTKRRKFDDEWQLNISQWLGAPEDSDDEDSDDDEDDDDLTDDDDDSDDDDDDSDDDDEEDEDEKPAPAKRAKAKTAAAAAKAKAAKKRARDDDEDDEDDDDSF